MRECAKQYKCSVLPICLPDNVKKLAFHMNNLYRRRKIAKVKKLKTASDLKEPPENQLLRIRVFL